MTEPTLFTPPPADGNLTHRQAHALELLVQQPAGLRATDVGVSVHQAFSNPCSCSATSACKWAMAAGLEVLRALKKRDLVVQRKGGLWQQHHRAPAESEGRSDSTPRSAYDPATAPFPDGY